MNIIWETEANYPFLYSDIKCTLHSKQLLHASVDGKIIPVQENTIITPIFHNLTFNIE